MSSDLSRRRDELGYGYQEVVAQQGRVILDRDFNALQGLTADRIVLDALDVVGPCGTPDDGFAIGLPVASPPTLYSPPAFPDPNIGQRFDFLISPGTMYVGGQRAFLPGRQDGKPISYSYYDQPDWIAPPDPELFESPPGYRELVYLDLEEQEVGAVEDLDLLEIALGGPDTTARRKLMRRVRRQAVSHADCYNAWQEAVLRWLHREGLQLDPHTRRLEPAVRLLVGFTQDVAASDPCDPVAAGGFLGADNQLIRVQISHSGSLGAGGEQARLLWGFDNASFLYRISSVSADGTTLTLAADPPDSFHIPQNGQLVEILRTEAVLGQAPDQTDPTGQRSIVRVVAAPAGELRHLTQPYGPVATGDPTSYIVLDSALHPDYAKSATPLFLRVWQAELSFNPAGDTVPLNDPASGASTGVQVTISVPVGEIIAKRAFWQLAMRPATPQAVYPERLLTAPQPPDGPRRFVCPLAVIDWQEGTVQDCRCQFDNLVALTKRPRCCCVVSVTPDELTVTKSLQSIIDAAVERADQVTVCLMPGPYVLQQPLRLDRRHQGIVIEGCGGAATLLGSGPEFGDGLVVLTETCDVTLRGLTLIPATVEISRSLFEPLIAGLERVVVLRARQTAAEFAKLLYERLAIELSIGIRVANVADLVIERCSVELSGAPAGGSSTAENYFSIGVFGVGVCPGLTVRSCQFSSKFAPTSTLGIVQPRGLSVPAFQFTPQPSRFGLQAAIGCLVSPYVQGFLDPKQQNGIEPFTLPAQLDGASFSDNSFEQLTLAIAVMADIGAIRVDHNTVTKSIGGIWIKTNELSEFRFAVNDALPDDGDTLWLDLTLSNQECFVLLLLGLIYPLPAGARRALNQRAAGPASIFISDNHITALPPDPTRAATGTCALAVFTGPSTVQTDVGAALVISANRMQGQLTAQYPTALLSYSGRCSVTGNLISAEPFGSPPGEISLLIVPEGFRNRQLVEGAVVILASHLAVTGNVLEGTSNLDKLVRPEVLAQPFNVGPFNNTPLRTWLFLNGTA